MITNVSFISKDIKMQFRTFIVAALALGLILALTIDAKSVKGILYIYIQDKLHYLNYYLAIVFI